MQKLPKIDSPKYRITIPSTKRTASFRPFLVKEEKILLMAKESENLADIFHAIKQIVNNCSVEDKFDIDKLTVFDLEYIFLKIRAFSVDNLVKASYRDTEDNKLYEFEINLNEIEVKFPDSKKNANIIKISDKAGIIMRYPPATLYDDKEFLNIEKDYMFELIIKCIEKIYFEEEVYEAKDYNKEELIEFLEDLSVKVFEEIQEFLVNTPKIEHVLKYKNALDNDREITLNSLNDFFTWR